MKSSDLILHKNDKEYLILEEHIIIQIIECFNHSNIKTNKIIKKQVNILKNNKIQNKKDLIENKLIMIMNKVSHNNINNLIYEYITTINITTDAEYDLIQLEILAKIIKDITFINNYIPFIIKIFAIEKHKLSLLPTTFINSIYNIIYCNYINCTSSDTAIDENERLAYLTLIKKLIENNFFNNEMSEKISHIILNNTLYKVDIFYWFNDMKNISLYQDKLIENINYCKNNMMKREELMIENLLASNITCNNNSNMNITCNSNMNMNITCNNNTNVKEDPVVILINNIIEEYLYLNIISEVEHFISSELKDIELKNIFCKELISIYITSNSEKRSQIIKLFDFLIKNKNILKSNISKGLLLYMENNNNINNIEGFLQYLKINNITNNIEHIFKKYKIKLTTI